MGREKEQDGCFSSSFGSIRWAGSHKKGQPQGCPFLWLLKERVGKEGDRMAVGRAVFVRRRHYGHQQQHCLKGGEGPPARAGGCFSPGPSRRQLYKCGSTSRESSQMVTGPQLTSRTHMSAPNTPVAAGRPFSSLTFWAKRANMAQDQAGSPAWEKEGRRPLRQSA